MPYDAPVNREAVKAEVARKAKAEQAKKDAETAIGEKDSTTAPATPKKSVTKSKKHATPRKPGSKGPVDSNDRKFFNDEEEEEEEGKEDPAPSTGDTPERDANLLRGAASGFQDREEAMAMLLELIEPDLWDNDGDLEMDDCEFWKYANTARRQFQSPTYHGNLMAEIKVSLRKYGLQYDPSSIEVYDSEKWYSALDDFVENSRLLPFEAVRILQWGVYDVEQVHLSDTSTRTPATPQQKPLLKNGPITAADWADPIFVEANAARSRENAGAVAHDDYCKDVWGTQFVKVYRKKDCQYWNQARRWLFDAIDVMGRSAHKNLKDEVKQDNIFRASILQYHNFFGPVPVVPEPVDGTDGNQGPDSESDSDISTSDDEDTVKSKTEKRERRDKKKFRHLPNHPLLWDPISLPDDHNPHKVNLEQGRADLATAAEEERQRVELALKKNRKKSTRSRGEKPKKRVRGTSPDSDDSYDEDGALKPKKTKKKQKKSAA